MHSGIRWDEIAGTGEKAQFFPDGPHWDLIRSQKGNLSCGLAGEQFIPCTLSVYAIRCELTPGKDCIRSKINKERARNTGTNKLQRTMETTTH